jgi:hypothetical protein
MPTGEYTEAANPMIPASLMAEGIVLAPSIPGSNKVVVP